MLYVKARDGVVIAYPYTQTDLIRDNPSTSFPAGGLPPSSLAKWDMFSVHFSPVPEVNPAVEKLTEVYPLFDGTSWIQQWVVVPLTQEEIDYGSAAKSSGVRADRNARLAACDWTQVADAPVDKAVWATYRQELRDITSQPGFPWQITWPVAPQ